MARKTTKARAESSDSVAALEGFLGLAGLVAGRVPPDWLVTYFQRWSASLAVHRHAWKQGATKAEVVDKLKRCRKAALQICNILSDETTRAFLAHPKYGAEVHVLEVGIARLAQLAEEARLSPALSTKAGKTRPGPGPAVAPGVLSPHVYCAMMIVEAWKSVRDDYPGARNKEAAEAAEMFWELSVLPGGERLPRADRISFSDKRNAWRPHFEDAMDPRSGFEADRSKLHRYLSFACRDPALESILEEKGP